MVTVSARHRLTSDKTTTATMRQIGKKKQTEPKMNKKKAKENVPTHAARDTVAHTKVSIDVSNEKVKCF